jgi:hypothetical protein
MKLPLFHRRYQGKHERGQVPRQREDSGLAYEQETAYERETADERWETADKWEAREARADVADASLTMDSPGTMPEARETGPADVPMQRPPTADEPADSSQPRQ